MFYRQTAFTLIEILVVLSILAVFIAVSSPFLVNKIQSAQFHEALREMAYGMVKARQNAVTTQRPTVFSIDLKDNSYRVENLVKKTKLLDDITLSVTTIEDELIDSQSAVIRFYPDGSSTGGRVELALGKQMQSILIDWMTGRVSIIE